MSVIGGIRQKLTQVVENGHAVTRLVARGFIEPLDLGATVQTAKLAATYGPQATMAIQPHNATPTRKQAEEDWTRMQIQDFSFSYGCRAADVYVREAPPSGSAGART